MITSRHIFSLIESYVASGKVYQGVQFPIYLNPGSSDYLALEKAARDDNRKLKEVRFIADANTRKFYICDSYLGLHEELLRSLGLSVSNSGVIGGIMTISSGRPQYIDILLKVVESFKFNWTFADKYFSGFSTEMSKLEQDYRFRTK